MSSVRTIPAAVAVAGLAATLVAAATVPAHAQVSTGTAFAVTQDGDLVTNAHVITGCTSVEARLGSRQFSGTVKASDPRADLAIVHIDPRGAGPSTAVLRQSPALRAGDQAITFGFPLSGTLTPEGNLTIGSVSALRGLADNPDFIQVTTPVQPGNSGGALLDASGHVIGVVTSKLNAMRMLQATGDVPQNINFAIGLEALARFLRANGIRVAEAVSGEELRPADIGDDARLFSYSVRCTRSASTVVAGALVAPAAKPITTVRITPPPGEHAPIVESAVLYEEDAAEGKSFAGTVIWHTGTVTAGAGPGRDKTIRATVQIPAHLTLTLLLRPNRDPNVPAGHVVDLTTSSDPPAGGVQSVAGVLVKDKAEQRGTPLVGRIVRQAPGLFAAYLSPLPNETARNLDLLGQRAYLSIALVYNNGTRAILLLRKGTTGERVFDEAFADWQKAGGEAPAGEAPTGR